MIELDDDARRIIAQRDALVMQELRGAAPPGTYEFGFFRRDPAGFDDVDRALLLRLCWHYRDRLSAHWRPKVNPADPIVRELADV